MAIKEEEKKRVNDPHPDYDAMSAIWKRNRAIFEGEDAVKKLDNKIDTVRFTNMLLPFSTKMQQAQYDFFRAEAELPGIVSQFSSTLINGLLRKPPTLTLPTEVPTEALDWVLENFGKDDMPLSAFLAEALKEEMPTNRAWIYVDRPVVAKGVDLTVEEIAAQKPFPVIWEANEVINWRYNTTPTGQVMLSRVIIKQDVDKYEEGEFHPCKVPTVFVHELDAAGLYRIRKFEKDGEGEFEEVFPAQVPVRDDLPLKFIPAWPLNGSIPVTPVILSAFISKEIALYNKTSRRNHTLYGAATYTPYILTDMDDAQFDDAVAGGIGDWMKLNREDKLGILETPFQALESMDKAITGGMEEMAKLGIRMLSPEIAQSGVALELRNATQVAQLGALSGKVVATMKQAIAFMVNWRYGTEISDNDVDLKLAEDFSNMPLGADWMRLVTEWYESKLIPRSLWLSIGKKNDIVPSEYDDEEGLMEITDDDLLPDIDEETNKNAISGGK